MVGEGLALGLALGLVLGLAKVGKGPAMGLAKVGKGLAMGLGLPFVFAKVKVYVKDLVGLV